MADTISVGIYNSAGELVRRLYSGKSQAMPGGFTDSVGAFVSGSGGVTLNFNGLLQTGGKALIWKGENDSGQPVSGGTYLIKVSTVDPFGGVQSWANSVSVLPPQVSQSLTIFNSAGEVVAKIPVGSFSTRSINQLGIGGDGKSAFVLGSGGGVPLVMQDAAGLQVTYTWNGMTSSGQSVAPGSYVVELVENNSGGVVVTQTKGFVVLGDLTKKSFDVLAGPNPLGAADKVLVFGFSGIQAGQTASVRLYNVAGELISQGQGVVGGGKVMLSVGPWSAGIYVAVAESREGMALVSRKLVHIAVER